MYRKKLYSIEMKTSYFKLFIGKNAENILK